ncbi:MAG: HAD family phosphatase [Bacteriovoracaceae bacterium]|nr:HAD family phosphatase [Bacteriovoracaceae bacterium]
MTISTKDSLFQLELSEIPNALWLDQMKGQFKGICLDMDGTLLNTEPLHSQAIWNLLGSNAFQFKGQTIENSQQLNKALVGLSDSDVFHLFQEESNLVMTFSLEEFIFNKNEFLIEKCESEVLKMALYTEMIDFLNMIRELKIPCALVSASQKKIVNSFVTRLELSDYFSLILGAEDTNRTKPHPEPYLHAVSYLKVNSQECLVFEDSVPGMTSAKAAGLHVIKADWF